MASWTLEIAVAAAIWIGFFKFNTWFAAYIDLSPVISWVFLPAAVRLISVMLLGWRGFVALFIGALVTNHAFDTLAHSLVVAVLSAGGPLLALTIGRRWLGLRSSLQGLTPAGLFQLAVLAASCNAVPHNAFFWLIGLAEDPLAGIGPMFIGDLLGILIVLYGARAAFAGFDHFQRERQAG